MPTTDEIETRVKEIIREQVGGSRELNANTSLANDLAADSLTVTEIIMETEERFELRIPNAAVEKIRTVGDLISYVQANA